MAAAAPAVPVSPSAASRAAISSFVGAVRWVAGNMDRGFADGKAGVAEFQFPRGLARTADAKGDDLVLVADEGNHRIRSINLKTQVVATYAGTGKDGAALGPLQTAELRAPGAVALDRADGSVLVALSRGNDIRRIKAGVVSRFAGSGAKGSADGPALTATFNAPSDVAVTHNGSGVVYVADGGSNKIRAVDAHTGIVKTVAGSGALASTDGTGAAAALAGPRYMAFDTATPVRDTALFVTTSLAIRRVDTLTGAVTTVPLVPLTKDKPFDPHGIVCTPSGALIFGCFRANSLYLIADPATGKVEPLAGTGVTGFYDGAATKASFNHPDALMLHAGECALYISDCGNDRIRRLTLAPELFVAKVEQKDVPAPAPAPAPAAAAPAAVPAVAPASPVAAAASSAATPAIATPDAVASTAAPASMGDALAIVPGAASAAAPSAAPDTSSAPIKTADVSQAGAH